MQSSLLPTSVETAVVAAERAEDRKIVAVGNLASDSSLLFAPFELESSGSLGKSARIIMKELSIRYADRHFNERATSMIQLKQRLSIIVHRFNSNMIISRHQGIPEGSSQLKVNEKLSFCPLNETERSSLMKRKAPTLTTPAFENDIGPRVGCGKKHRFEIVEERVNEDDDCCTTTNGIRTTPPQQSFTNPASPIPFSGTTPLVTLP